MARIIVLAEQVNTWLRYCKESETKATVRLYLQQQENRTIRRWVFFFFGGRKAGKEVAKMNLMFKNNYIVKIYIHLKRNATYLEDLYKINIEEKQECHPVTVREEPP